MVNRTMIDCTGANAESVHVKVPSVGVVGIYVTGSNGIKWTVANPWPDATVVTIDQGFQSPKITEAIVRDVEPNAWDAVPAADRETWSSDVARPTIYTDRDELPAVLNAGWIGDLWLAIPGWQEGEALPDVGKCTVVAVQNMTDVDGLYDSSVLLDASWPAVAAPTTIEQSGWEWCSKCQSLFYGPFQFKSSCTGGGKHDGANSDDYILTAVRKPKT